MHLEDVDPREFAGTYHKFLCRKNDVFYIAYYYRGRMTTTDYRFGFDIEYFDEVKLIVYKVD